MAGSVTLLRSGGIPDRWQQRAVEDDGRLAAYAKPIGSALVTLGTSVALAAGDTNVCNLRWVHSTTPALKKGNLDPTAPLWVQIVSPSRTN